MSLPTDDTIMAAANDEQAAAAIWLANFARAIEHRDAQGIAATFLPGGLLRDVLTFSWDTRSLRGREEITRYLSEDNRLSEAHVTDIALETDPFFTPRPSLTPSGEQVGIEAGFTYETRHSIGRGYAHLQKAEGGAWQAITVGMLVLDLKAHPEPQNVATDWESAGKPWDELEAERKAKIEASPHVLVGRSSMPFSGALLTYNVQLEPDNVA